MKNVNTVQKQDGFKSQWGFIMAAVGSCVGMANVWRGLTFLIPYFIFVFIISQSGMMEEISMGRWAGTGPSGAFGKAMENGGRGRKAGERLGIIPVIGSLCLAIGYSVIMGWVFYYVKMAFTGELTAMGQDMDAIGGTFGSVAPEADNLLQAVQMTLETGGANNLWITVGIVVSFLIMIMGVAGGIEKSCKIMIPVLYVLFITLAVFMLFMPGTSSGYQYIFSLDPAGLLDPQVWVYAFGQCFFSLGNGGPGLMFIYVLPVFNSMGVLARVIVIFFYVAILFAGLSSVINLFETPINFLQEQLHMKRWTATALIHGFGLITALLIQPWTSQWMDTVSIYILPLGALTAGVMFFWVMKRDTAMAAVQLGAEKPMMKWFYPFGRYIFVPLCVLCFILGIAWGGIG